MLPTLGCFRVFPCQHCIAGLCTRPNCFFSHGKLDIATALKKPERKEKQRALGQQLGLGPLHKSLPLPTHGKGTDEDSGLLASTSSNVSSSSAACTSTSSASVPKLASVPSSQNGDSTKSHTPKSYSEHLSEIGRKRSREDIHKHHAAEKRPKLNHTSSKPVINKDDAVNGSYLKEEQRKKSDQPKVDKLSDYNSNKTSKKEETSSSHHSRQPHHHRSAKDKEKAETDLKSKTQPPEDVDDNIYGDIDEMFSPVPDICSDGDGDEGSNITDLSSEFLFPEHNEETDDDPDQVAFECLQMFNNYKPELLAQSQPDLGSSSHSRSTLSTVNSSESPGKVRVAHSGPSTSTLYSTGQVPPKIKTTPAEAMLRRYEGMKKETPVKMDKHHSINDVHDAPVSKKRIAHVTNVSGLLKPKIMPGVTANIIKTTVAHTIGKGQSRQAHTPKDLPAYFESPKISIETMKQSKVPIVVRQKILNLIFEECRKIYIEPRDAAERALAEETEISKRCASKTVYFCAGTNAVARLRKEYQDSDVRPVSDGGNKPWSVEAAKKMPWPPSRTCLYVGISRYLLTEDELVENGYPRSTPLGRGRAVAKTNPRASNLADLSSNPSIRTCDRCMKSYKLDKDGFPQLVEHCVYHYGRKFKRRSNGLIDGRYTCCDGDVSAEGCSVADYHVSSSSSTELRGFVTTVKECGEDEKMGLDQWDIVAIDCEMIYTTAGNELARATFIGADMKVLYDKIVKPIFPILDFNTRFSGITPELMASSTTSLTDVQAVLLTHLKPNSILVGHSLESDLLALKLIHNTVVDTSVLFPHRIGPPCKRALRNLASEYLGKIIQMDESGHDSAEDARSALEVVMWKLKEDCKLQDCFTKS